MVSPNSNKRKQIQDQFGKKPSVSEAFTIRQLTNESNSLTQSHSNQNHAFKPYNPLSYVESRVPYHIPPPYISPQAFLHVPPTTTEREKNILINDDDIVEATGIELTATQLIARKILVDTGFYKVEAIRRKRISKEGKPQYLIKWRDFEENANNWEYVENLDEPSRDIIAEYERSLLSEEQMSSAKGKQKLTPQKNRIRYSYGSASTSNISPAMRPPLSYERQVVDAFVNSGNANPEPLVNSNRTQSTERPIVQALEAYNPSNPKPRRAYSKRPASNGRVGAAESSKVNSKLSNPEPRKANIAVNQNEAFNIATAAKSVDRNGSQTVSPAVASLNRNYASLQLPGQNAYGNSVFFGEKIPDSRENATIIRINKAIRHFFIPGDNKLSVTFEATCSDGTVITVENKYLRANYPDLLLDFYENQVRYTEKPIIKPVYPWSV